MQNENDTPIAELSSDFDDLTDETITTDLMDEMKALGLPKPQNVSFAKWIGPRDHKHRHELIIRLAAGGMTNVQIADEIGMSAARVGIVLAQPANKAKVKAVQEQLWGENVKKRMQTIASKALDTVEEIMNNKQERGATRLQASTYVLDQAVGKAQQTVNVQGSVLGELIHRIDTMAVRDVAPLNALDAPQDTMDNFVNDLIPDQMTVGKKGR